MTDVTVISTPAPTVTVLSAPSPSVTVVSLPGGVQGPPGPTGPAGGAASTYTAAIAISGHVAAKVEATGKISPASSDTLSDAARLVGITLNAAAQDADCTVQAGDVITHSGWAFTPDALIFLGLNGALVESVPVSAVFTQVIGKAIAPTKVLIGIQPPIAR